MFRSKFNRNIFLLKTKINRLKQFIYLAFVLEPLSFFCTNYKVYFDQPILELL